MLEANKNWLFENIFAVYNQNLLKRRFNSLWVSGLDFLINKNTNLPLIIYCNHSSWWDGLVAFQISRKTNLNSFLIMEEKQLEKYFLFRRLGVFSVNREIPREALKSLNYAAKLLQTNPNRTLWIFPQGEIINNNSRPISFFNGLSKIIEKLGQCLIASLAIRYEFLGEYKPDIFVKINKPALISINKNFDSKKMTDDFAGEMELLLDELSKDILYQNTTTYFPII